MNKEIGEMLAEVRDASSKTQKDIALAISGNQTRVSRLEAGDGVLDDAILYLNAVGTDEAADLAAKLQFSWKNLLTPSLRHPDIEALMEIETALDRLRTFLADGEVPKVLAGQAELLLSRLEDVGRFLFELNHEIVYVGEIGAGKTTAACRQAGLVIDPQTASDLKGLLLDTGGEERPYAMFVWKRATAFRLQSNLSRMKKYTSSSPKLAAASARKCPVKVPPLKETSNRPRKWSEHCVTWRNCRVQGVVKEFPLRPTRQLSSPINILISTSSLLSSQAASACGGVVAV